MSVKVTLPDGKELQLREGATGLDAATAIGPGLAKAALAVRVSHPEVGEQPQTQDLALRLQDGASIEILTAKSGEHALALIRHDAAHVLATAVMELYPGVKVSIGPAIEDGFYYDFDFPEGVSLSEEAFPALEERMQAHVKAAEPFLRSEVAVTDARKRFLSEGQDYKVELIDDLLADAKDDQPLRTVSLYENGPFVDLCRGPHSPSTGNVGAFKLQSVAGAYWRGDSSRQMLTRIYGTAFFSKAQLEEHLERIEQARARDHRRIGREMGLFAFSDLSPGSPFWKPDGMIVWNELTKLWREENRVRGYREVKTPIIYDVELWKQSGHWETYKENMYVTEVEERTMGLKPMNCPGHVQLYKDERRSYRDLPIRYSEAGLVHRHEPSGVLHGLLRVRHITQDDAHIFCTEDQVEQEVVQCLKFGFALYEIFGFAPRLELSTRPQKRIGDDRLWDRAEKALADALASQGLEYELNPGDGAFYGPKIDLHMTDSIGRSWQLGTVQLDYMMPERFDITYTGADNSEHRPVMIHRALLGSFERFIGILIEHYAGQLPLWLSPVQASVLSISESATSYAGEVARRLQERGLRVKLDDRGESLGRKVRDAELAKVPYMLIVGEREAAQRTVSVRERSEGDEGSVALAEIETRLLEQVRNRG